MNDFVKYVRKYHLTLADEVVITYDNVKILGEFIGVSAIRRVMNYYGDIGYFKQQVFFHTIQLLDCLKNSLFVNV